MSALINKHRLHSDHSDVYENFSREFGDTIKRIMLSFGIFLR